MKKTFIACSLIALLGLGTTSCDNEPFELGSELIKKEEVVDNTVAKIRFENALLGSSYVETEVAASITPSAKVISKEEITLNLELSAPAPEDFTATLAIEANEEVRKAYKAQMGKTVSEDMVDGTFSLSSNTVSFRAGEKTAEIKLTIDQSKVNSTSIDPVVSLAAVIVKSTSSAKVGVVSSLSKHFISLSASYTNLKPQGSATTLISRTPLNLASGFTLIQTGDTRTAAFYGSSAEAYDGLSDTRWHMALPTTRSFNMSDYFEITFSPQPIAGLAIMPADFSGRVNTPINSCTISVQVNGEWTVLGKTLLSPRASQYSYIEFFESIEGCTGIRIHPNTGVNGRHVAIGELKLY